MRSGGQQPVVMGVETEYGAICSDRRGRAADPEALLSNLLMFAAHRFPSLPDGSGEGIFLENGARLYVDCGHLEYSTPECTNPWDLVRYQLAGDAFAARLARQAGEAGGKMRLAFSRCGVDYSGTGNAWGSCHESYGFTGDLRMLGDQLTPFLVSRIIVTGGGGFDNTLPGLAFLISPRVAHLRVRRAMGTHLRPLFDIRHEPLCRLDGYHRVHLVCGEACQSWRSSLLRAGVTALVIRCVEIGCRPADRWGLRRSLTSLKRLATNPKARLPLRAGGDADALTIQRAHLDMVRGHMADPRLPSWAGDVCCLWEEALAEVESGDAGRSLDWAIKRTLVEGHLQARGFTWPEVQRWSRVVRRIEEALDRKGCDIGSGLRPMLTSLLRVGARIRLDWERLEQFLEAQEELFALDIQWGAVEEGPFQDLDRSGALHHRVDGIEPVEPALTIPPSDTRARVRGELVSRWGRKRRRERLECDWDGIVDLRQRRRVDLPDPLQTNWQWVDLPFEPMAPSDDEDDLEEPFDLALSRAVATLRLPI